MSCIRLGMIGLGGIAQGVHLPGVERSPDLTLAAVCDLDPHKLRLVGERYGVPEDRRYTDYRDLIACPDVEAVDICTPNDCHFAMAMAAAEAGKPFSLEKPITLTAGQADTLAAAVRERGLPNLVCFSYRFKAAARYARDLVARGQLGELYHVSMQYLQAWGLPERQTPLAWRFVAARTGTGVLGDLGSHALDLVRFVTGREVERVMGQAQTFLRERQREDGSGLGRVDVDDDCNYLAGLSGGVSACFQTTRFGFGRGNYQRLEVYGSRGALVYKLDEHPEEDELEVCLGPVADETHTFTRLPIPAVYAADQMQAFADLLQGRGDGLSASVEDGRINQHALDAVARSCRTGVWEQPGE